MNYNQETYELIERYLRGELEGEELTRFEERMVSDIDLKAEVALQRSVESLLADEEVNKLDTKLAALRGEYTKPAKQVFMKRIWFAVAAMLVLLATFLVLFRGGNDLDNDALYIAYFELYPADNNVRSDDPVQNQLTEGLGAYEAEDFEKAISVLMPLIEKDARARFYVGISELALEKTEDGIRTLQSIDPQSVYADPADWYVALGWLKLNQEEKSRKVLKVLEARTRGKYQKLASELLDKLQ